LNNRSGENEQSFRQRLNKASGEIRQWFWSQRAVSPAELNTRSGAFEQGKLATLHHPQRDELICKMCDVLALLGDEFIMQQKPDIIASQKSHIQIVERFLEDIALHYHESHEVTFYAARQSLTPKYFASIIKSNTGKRASEHINQYIMTQARWLLQHERKQTIQQIAYRLGFTEQSSFSRFFKEYTGTTPTYYRLNI